MLRLLALAWLQSAGQALVVLGATHSPPPLLRRPQAPPHRRAEPRLGVSGFCKWIEAHFPRSVQQIGLQDGGRADVVAVDMNGLLHSHLRRARSHEHAIALVMKQLIATLRFARPRAAVLLAFDGPAPMAKFVTQRQRRVKAAKAWRPDDAMKPTPLHATPGTAFMASVENAMLYLCHSELATFRGKELRFYVSGADVPGEGEVKIIDWLISCDANSLPTRPSVYIVGGDGDLVLQALVLQGWDTRVLREVPRQCRANGTVIALDSLRRELEEAGLVRGRTPSGEAALRLPPSGATSYVGLDVVALFSMMGNDYLPKVLETSFDRLWRGYNALRAQPRFLGQTLLAADARGFNLPFLDALMRLVDATHSLAKAEAALLVAAGATPKEATAATSMVGLDRPTLYGLIGASLAAMEEEARGHAPPAAAAREQRPRYDAADYLAGILWVVQMYADGICPDLSWKYAGEYAPRCAQLSRFAARRDAPPAVRAPASRCEALPAPLMCALVLPHVIAVDLAPPEIAAELQEGGRLGFINEWMGQWERSGRQQREYEDLVASLRWLPAEVVSLRSRELVESPAWLELSRRNRRSGGKETSLYREQHGVRLPQIKMPELPPLPPTRRMPPLDKIPDLKCRWAPASRAPKYNSWALDAQQQQRTAGRSFG
ncbi:hypothetical protein AB1Y20_002895 [Prymnesium parvum]|uniref:Xrn1 N-terminal domain-containing protein n=1 Tax=Prymnesium parvum TaxID=97485 RepID=A0AB34JBW5_PRYPA